MGIVNSSKEVDKSSIACGESFNVKLSLTAVPEIRSNPTDIVLILDRSGSMTGQPLESLKSGAKKFVEIIDESTDDIKDGQIGLGSRIGIVSFSDIAAQDTQLITSVADLNTAIDNLTAGGFTNHKDAFTKALQMFDPVSGNAKVMIMFTDGISTVGGDAVPITDQAKAAGVTIYCIGLSNATVLDPTPLNAWASDPDSAYVSIAPSDAELEDMFEELANNISKAGATDIVINEIINDCFKITSVLQHTKGTVTQIDETTLQWKIDELGVVGSEGAVLEFVAEHNGVCQGTLPVNQNVQYTDAEGNLVLFDSPTIDVLCFKDAYPEPCPTPVEVTVDGCSDTVEFDAGELMLDSLGRIVEVETTIKNVCPNRRVALAVIATEMDSTGTEHKRGMKTMVVPAHQSPNCQDVKVHCIRFVMPEELDVSGNTESICNERKFNIRCIAHYIDSDYDCCGSIV